MGRPMTGTVTKRPISAGVAARRPVTAVDFGDMGPPKQAGPSKPSSSVRSRTTVESREEEEEEGNWFVNEASVCLVVGSDESEDEEEGDTAREKTSEDTLRDMVKTANEYFARSATDGGNWWE
jgi:hypothetical protein